MSDKYGGTFRTPFLSYGGASVRAWSSFRGCRFGDLSRRSNHVLGRVALGERLVVCRHGKPVATLQPLDGFVFQPFDGTVRDVFGWPVGGIGDEIAKLSEAQRVLLRDGYRQWRLWSGRVPYDVEGDRATMLSDLALRGLAKRTSCGWELTGRGLAMHEALQQRAGRD